MFISNKLLKMIKILIKFLKLISNDKQNQMRNKKFTNKIMKIKLKAKRSKLKP